MDNSFLKSIRKFMPGRLGQALFEATLFFTATLFLFSMMIRIWTWSLGQHPARYQHYNDTRVEAGTDHYADKNQPLIWVVENIKRGDKSVYNATELTKEWVFDGK